MFGPLFSARFILGTRTEHKIYNPRFDIFDGCTFQKTPLLQLSIVSENRIVYSVPHTQMRLELAVLVVGLWPFSGKVLHSGREGFRLQTIPSPRPSRCSPLYTTPFLRSARKLRLRLATVVAQFFAVIRGAFSTKSPKTDSYGCCYDKCCPSRPRFLWGTFRPSGYHFPDPLS